MKTRFLIIADDLTGAAEIGGIATRFGLTTHLLRTSAPPPADVDCVVYDTDSRLLDEAVAGNAARLTAAFAADAAFDLVFKKTDSVLRGSPACEIEWVAAVFRRPTTLFLPQNPSRGRTINGGRYRVNGVPLHETEFAADPIHPATTDAVPALLRRSDTRCLRVTDAIGDGIHVAEAATIDDVRTWAGRFDPATMLAAGGADFFEAIGRRLSPGRPTATPAAVVQRPLLIVSGTASRATAELRQRLSNAGQMLAMPNDLFDGTSGLSRSEAWSSDVLAVLHRTGAAMLTIGQPTDTTPGAAERLGNALCDAAARVMRSGDIRTVACEGGATAAALCRMLEWTQFTVESELTPGVVSLLPRGVERDIRLIVKPGSYAWPPIGI